MNKFFSFTSFSIKKQTFFAKRLSFLVKAGIPLLESIHILKKQTGSKHEEKILNSLISDISSGHSLAKSLARLEGVFGNFSINLVKAGEVSGNLTENLHYLAEELQKKETLRKKILSAMLYPIIILVATLGITLLLLMYVFPKILPIFESLKAKLPWSTRTVIFLSETLRDYGLYILLGFVLFLITAALAKKYFLKVKRASHELALHFPIAGTTIKNYNLANLTRTLGLLLKSGMSLTQALSITAETTENLPYQEALTHISRKVIKGKNVSELLAEYPTLFPEMLRQMILVGERSGHLSATLIYLSEFYENELDDLTKNLSGTLEPALLILMGTLVGLIAISVITPIYEITNNLKK